MSFLIILNSFQQEFVLIISPVLFISQETMSKIFFSQYINFEMLLLFMLTFNFFVHSKVQISKDTNFKMNAIIVIMDNLAINNNPNTKKIRFSGTPCTFLRKACGGLEWWVVVIVGGDGWW